MLLLDRFDRAMNGRIPFLSAMAALGASDHDDDKHSYMELVDFLRQHGARKSRPVAPRRREGVLLQVHQRSSLFLLLPFANSDYLRVQSRLVEASVDQLRYLPVSGGHQVNAVLMEKALQILPG